MQWPWNRGVAEAEPEIEDDPTEVEDEEEEEGDDNDGESDDDTQDTDEEAKLPEFGNKVGDLTQFGILWINMSEVAVIDLDPDDGCEAEIQLKNGKTWHLPDPEAAALKAYLKGTNKPLA